MNMFLNPLHCQHQSPHIDMPLLPLTHHLSLLSNEWNLYFCSLPLPTNRHHLFSDDFLEDKVEHYREISMKFWKHIHEICMFTKSRREMSCFPMNSVGRYFWWMPVSKRVICCITSALCTKVVEQHQYCWSEVTQVFNTITDQGWSVIVMG